MAVAENEEQVLDLLKKDIYTTSGVWDLENAQIIPVCYGLWSWALVFRVLFTNLTAWFSSSLLFGSLSSRLQVWFSFALDWLIFV